MFGLGKKRSKLGKWIDQNGITQKQLASASSISEDTITRVCSDTTNKKPTKQTASSIIRGIKKLTGADVTIKDFWA